MKRTLFLVLLASCDPPAGETDVPEHTDPPALDEVVMGVHCELHDKIAQVDVMWAADSAQLSAVVYDRSDPWMDAPALSNDACDYHTFNTGGCGACDSGMVCGVSGGCVPERRTVKTASVQLSVDGSPTRLDADSISGQMYGSAGSKDSLVGAVLTWPDHEVTLPARGLAQGVTDMKVVSYGDYDKPGALDISWAPASAEAQVGTLIPINHHAGGPTFTTCHVGGQVGNFRADAAMVDPLSISTGLEFQGVLHYAVGAAQTTDGCVEFRLGTRWYVDVTFE